MKPKRRRKPGRPRIGRAMIFRAPTDLVRAIDEVSKEFRSTAAALRMLIALGLEARQKLEGKQYGE